MRGWKSSRIGNVPDPSSPTDDVSILKMEGRKRSGLRDYIYRSYAEGNECLW